MPIPNSNSQREREGEWITGTNGKSVEEIKIVVMHEEKLIKNNSFLRSCPFQAVIDKESEMESGCRVKNRSAKERKIL